MRALATIAAITAIVLTACSYQEPDRTVTTTDRVAATATQEQTAPASAPAPATGAVMDTFSIPENLETTSSGLQYTIDAPGTGVTPRTGQTVSVHYTGWLTNGEKFDSSRDRGAPLEFPIGMGRVIKGWDEGVGAMKVGEKRTLVIPPALGYGPRGARGLIPPNATLVFKVELVGVR